MSFKVLVVPEDYELPEDVAVPESTVNTAIEELVKNHPEYKKVVRESISRKEKIRELMAKNEQPPEDSEVVESKPERASENKESVDITTMLETMTKQVVDSVLSVIKEEREREQQIRSSLSDFPEAIRRDLEEKIMGKPYDVQTEIIQIAKSALVKTGALNIKNPTTPNDDFSELKARISEKIFGAK